MASFRWSSSCSPSRVAGCSVQQSEVVENENNDPYDPDQLVQCPFDKSHQIRACRFPYHIVKCAKNHPKLAKEMKTCPFNAKHIIHQHELSHHIASCEDRRLVNPDNSGNADMQRMRPVPVSTWTNPNCEEDWEKETEELPEAPFIWGVSNTQLGRSQPSSSDMPAGIRAPKMWPMCSYMNVTGNDWTV